MQTAESANCKLTVVVYAADGPDSSDFFELFLNYNADIRRAVEHNDVTVSHPYRYLFLFVQCAHAVDTFSHFYDSRQLQGKALIHEHSPITTANEEVVTSYDRAIHLSVLNIQLFDYLRRVVKEHIDVIFGVVCDYHLVANRRHVLHIELHSVNILRRRFWFVQIFEMPHVLQESAPHDVICILGVALDLDQGGEVVCLLTRKLEIPSVKRR